MALPSPLIILLKGQQTLTVEGALSEALVEIEYSDATTYRNELPAAYLGRDWSVTVTTPFVSGGEPEGADDRLNNVPPQNTVKTRDMMTWIGQGGALVGKCWADQFIGYGKAANFIQ